MTREQRLELLKQIEKDIHVCSLESTLLDDAKSCAIHSTIEELEQEPKMGQWIIYNYPGHECVYCSSCKEEYYEDDLYMGGSDFPKYCPNCGCRMVKPQESEEV